MTKTDLPTKKMEILMNSLDETVKMISLEQQESDQLAKMELGSFLPHSLISW
jgi:hypothetical protein